jgi:hypothetical protein
MAMQGDIANLMSLLNDIMDFFRSAHETIVEKRKVAGPAKNGELQTESGAADKPDAR